MFGLAMFIFSGLVLQLLDIIHERVVADVRKEVTSNPIAVLFCAFIIGLFSEIGLRIVVK